MYERLIMLTHMSCELRATRDVATDQSPAVSDSLYYHIFLFVATTRWLVSEPLFDRVQMHVHDWPFPRI